MVTVGVSGKSGSEVYCQKRQGYDCEHRTQRQHIAYLLVVIKKKFLKKRGHVYFSFHYKLLPIIIHTVVKNASSFILRALFRLLDSFH